MTYKSYLHEISSFILVLLMTMLIFIYFYPTLFYISSQYSVLGLENF